MSEEIIDAGQQKICDVAEEMTKSMASVRELIQALRETYGLPALLTVCGSYNPSTQKRKDL
jgi:hypothetical protein